jgi:hypothetical protein
VGDAGVQALLEFVGTHDRVSQKSEKPSFGDDSQVEDEETTAVTDDEAPITDEAVTDEAVTDDDGAADDDDVKAEAATDEGDATETKEN